jgi:FKBP-type peptidyl-prolyl cis-trans isomerase FkpA
MNCFLNKYFLLITFMLMIFSVACREEKPPVTKEEYAARKQQLMEVNRALVRKDQQKIKEYLERNSIQMEETNTGLWYRINSRGSGPACKSGQVVIISYKLSLLDGTECYNSSRDGKKTFQIGRGGVESGLEEGILFLRQGDKAVFIMPPHLAYGLTGDGSKIPARATIIYEIEVLSVE